MLLCIILLDLFLLFFLIPSLLCFFDWFTCSLLVFICFTCLLVYSFFSNSFNLKCSAFSIRFFPFHCCIWWFVDTFHVAICFESRILFFSCIFADKWNAYVFLHHKNVPKWTSSNGLSCMSHVKASIHLLSTRASSDGKFFMFYYCYGLCIRIFAYSYSNRYDKKATM